MKTKTINQHEEKYWHIPKFKIGLIALFLLMLIIDFGYSFIFISEWKSHNIGFVFNCEAEECNSIGLFELGFIPQLFFAYILISLTFVILIAGIKGGFNKLKKYSEEGLISGLISGLILGLTMGLTMGLISGLILGLILGLIWGLIVGLISGLILGLTMGLTMGLILGLILELIGEFKN